MEAEGQKRENCTPLSSCVQLLTPLQPHDKVSVIAERAVTTDSGVSLSEDPRGLTVFAALVI